MESRISLIVPNLRRSGGLVYGRLPSRGLLCLAAVLRDAGHAVEYVDADFEDLSHRDVLDRVRSFATTVVGITMSAGQVFAGVELARRLREDAPHLKIVVGGAHPSALPVPLLQECSFIDLVCIGEGERTVVELVEALDRNEDLSTIPGLCLRRGDEIVLTPPRPLIDDIDGLPLPAYDLVSDLKGYPGFGPRQQDTVMHVMGARGCPFGCEFCSKHPWGRTLRQHGTAHVIAEIRLLKETHGIEEIQFADDVLNVNGPWFHALCDEIVTHGLDRENSYSASFRVNRELVSPELLRAAVRAGFWLVDYGVESGNQGILDAIGKGIDLDEVRRAFALSREAGLQTGANIMLGHLDETVETVEDTIALIKEIRPTYLNVNLVTPIPGTELFLKALHKGLIVPPGRRNHRTQVRSKELDFDALLSLRDRLIEETRTSVGNPSV